MLHEELTERILAACFDVANELGHGFLESVYERALLIALCDRGLKAENQARLKVSFRGETVGDFLADTLVEGKVIVELKAVGSLLPEHQAQVINYLRATGLDVGLLVNFGTPHLQYKRCVNKSVLASSASTPLLFRQRLTLLTSVLILSIRSHPAHPVPVLTLLYPVFSFPGITLSEDSQIRSDPIVRSLSHAEHPVYPVCVTPCR